MTKLAECGHGNSSRPAWGRVQRIPSAGSVTRAHRSPPPCDARGAERARVAHGRRGEQCLHKALRSAQQRCAAGERHLAAPDRADRRSRTRALSSPMQPIVRRAAILCGSPTSGRMPGVWGPTVRAQAEPSTGGTHNNARNRGAGIKPEPSPKDSVMMSSGESWRIQIRDFSRSDSQAAFTTRTPASCTSARVNAKGNTPAALDLHRASVRFRGPRMNDWE